MSECAASGGDRLEQRLATLSFAPMCGRVRLSSDVSEIKLVFLILPHRPTPNLSANAKAEGIENTPAFRDAFQRRRCIVPVDNFCEWKKTATGKQPYAVALADGGLMALAGL